MVQKERKINVIISFFYIIPSHHYKGGFGTRPIAMQQITGPPQRFMPLVNKKNETCSMKILNMILSGTGRNRAFRSSFNYLFTSVLPLDFWFKKWEMMMTNLSLGTLISIPIIINTSTITITITTTPHLHHPYYNNHIIGKDYMNESDEVLWLCNDCTARLAWGNS